MNNYHDIKKQVPLSGINTNNPSDWCAQFQLLPYIEQAAMYTAVMTAYANGSGPPANVTGIGIETFICPARPHGSLAATSGGNYPGYNGPFTDYKLTCLRWQGHYPGGFESNNGNNGWGQRTPKIGLQQITNFQGTAYSIYMGEGSMDPNFAQSNTNSSNWDECIFSGGYGGTNRWDYHIIADYPGNNGNNNWWGSPHPSSTVFGFCDGSARPISNLNSLTNAFGESLYWLNMTPGTLQ
jgi:hypothetical protein